MENNDYTYSQATVYRKLINERVIDYTKQAFAKYVKKGKIPFKMIDGKKKFSYAQTVLALRSANVRIDVKTSGKKSKIKSNRVADLSKLPLPEKGEDIKDYQSRVSAALPVDPTLEEAKIFQTIWMGKVTQQKYEVAEAKLINKSDVEKAAFVAAREIRTALLVIPERVSGQLAGEKDINVVKEILYDEILETLNHIADGEVFLP